MSSMEETATEAKQSLVSIVLPTYNGEKHLREAIDSCLGQTYRNIELVVVDDCSSDSTPEIVKSYSDSRVRYIRHEVNRRLPEALNTGFRATTGDYLTWTSDDNYYAPDAIEKMLEFCREHGCSFVYADMMDIYDDSDRVELRKHPETFQPRERCGIGACFLFTREVYDKVGDHDPEAELVEDFDYWIRVSEHFGVRHLPEAPYYYRNHSASLTAKFGGARVPIAATLVRLKNDVIGVEEAADELIRTREWMLRTQDSGLRGLTAALSGSRAARGALYRLSICSVALRYRADVVRWLSSYKSGRCSLAEVRRHIHDIWPSPGSRTGGS